MASSSHLCNLPCGVESNAGIVRGSEGQLIIAKVEISQVNDWLKSQLIPASNWGVSVGVSAFGLMLVVTLLVAYIRDRD